MRRSGVAAEIDPDEVVLDDIIEIGSGDQVVVDGEVVTAAALDVDESLLTGEADPIHKKPGNKIPSGSFVVAGSGAYRPRRWAPTPTPAQLAARHPSSRWCPRLRGGIDKILKVITWLLIPAGAHHRQPAVLQRQRPQTRPARHGRGPEPMVPEGLVLMTTIARSRWAWCGWVPASAWSTSCPRSRGLARVNVVCADKTGTLTENVGCAWGCPRRR